MKIWMLCEAFTLTCDHTTIHDYLSPHAIACESRSACLRELKKEVEERVRENYEGLRREDVEDDIEDDIDQVLAHPKKLGPGSYKYNYSCDDREVVWRVYRCDARK